MLIDTFHWQTQAAPSGNFAHNVRSAQFGDGYKQISSNGLNQAVQLWQLAYTGHPTVTQPMLDFLNQHVITAFFWTPPNGVKALFRVRSDSISVTPLARNVVALNFTFEQAFGV
jgi:phage-related protein